MLVPVVLDQYSSDEQPVLKCQHSSQVVFLYAGNSCSRRSRNYVLPKSYYLSVPALFRPMMPSRMEGWVSVFVVDPMTQSCSNTISIVKSKGGQNLVAKTRGKPNALGIQVSSHETLRSTSQGDCHTCLGMDT